LEKNHHIFSDEDENKLEYKTVYEDYVYLWDNALDVELKTAGFDEDTVK